MVSREWFENKGSDLMTLAGLFGGVMLLIVLSNLGFKEWALIAYFGLTFGVFGGTQLYAFIQAAKYPYIEMIIRPDNKRVHLFINPQVSRIQRTKHGSVAVLNLAYPRKILDYGVVKAVKIYYEGDWSKRLRFRPGWSNWNGVIINHPMTEVVEVYQPVKALTRMDHNEPIPVFVLRSASGDVLHNLQKAVAVVGGGSASMVDENVVAELKRIISSLEHDRAELQQRVIELEEVVEQQKNEMAGLLKMKTDVWAASYEVLLTILQAAGSIEAAARHLRGLRPPSLGKYAAYVIITALVLVFLWFNPQVLDQLLAFMQTGPGFIVTLIIFILIAYLIYRRVK